jgi:AcrR family transcriptional regulator
VGDTAQIDGRRARRERGRLAVIDAMFSLLQDGKVPVTAELVAERAGVSVASVFRYFDGLDDLQFQTFERFLERFAPVLDDPASTAERADRLAGFVDARLDLYEQAGAIMTVGRLRALEHEPLVAASGQMRSLLADQVRRCLDADLADASPGSAADLVALVDAVTSLEAWDVMRRTHARSRPQIRRAWIDALTGIVETGLRTGTARTTPEGDT